MRSIVKIGRSMFDILAELDCLVNQVGFSQHIHAGAGLRSLAGQVAELLDMLSAGNVSTNVRVVDGVGIGSGCLGMICVLPGPALNGIEGSDPIVRKALCYSPPFGFYVSLHQNESGPPFFKIRLVFEDHPDAKVLISSVVEHMDKIGQFSGDPELCPVVWDGENCCDVNQYDWFLMKPRSDLFVDVSVGFDVEKVSELISVFVEIVAVASGDIFDC